MILQLHRVMCVSARLITLPAGLQTRQPSTRFVVTLTHSLALSSRALTDPSASASERVERESVFAANLATIHEHNALHEAGLRFVGWSVVHSVEWS